MDSTIRTVTDPVCGANVQAGIARSWDYLYDDIVYNFCGSECRHRFSLDAKRILANGPNHPRTEPAPDLPSPKGGRLRAFFKKWQG